MTCFLVGLLLVKVGVIVLCAQPLLPLARCGTSLGLSGKGGVHDGR